MNGENSNLNADVDVDASIESLKIMNYENERLKLRWWWFRIVKGRDTIDCL
jgi:hypothetical protein